jgi:hypothetical protein
VDATRRDNISDWLLPEVYTFGRIGLDDVIFAERISGAGNGVPSS